MIYTKRLKNTLTIYTGKYSLEFRKPMESIIIFSVKVSIKERKHLQSIRWHRLWKNTVAAKWKLSFLMWKEFNEFAAWLEAEKQLFLREKQPSFIPLTLIGILS